jgi:hypothetical protein
MSDLAMKVCDQCKTMWPESEKFERGTIMVGKLVMCFPKAVVKARHRDGVSDSHCAFVEDKDFCSAECLAVYLKRIEKGLEVK